MSRVHKRHPRLPSRFRRPSKPAARERMVKCVVETALVRAANACVRRASAEPRVTSQNSHVQPMHRAVCVGGMESARKGRAYVMQAGIRTPTAKANWMHVPSWTEPCAMDTERAIRHRTHVRVTRDSSEWLVKRSTNARAPPKGVSAMATGRATRQAGRACVMRGFRVKHVNCPVRLRAMQTPATAMERVTTAAGRPCARVMGGTRARNANTCAR